MAECIILLKEASGITEYWMAGPKLSQQNVVQSITLPLSACLLPTVHPNDLTQPPRLGSCHQTHSNPYACPFSLLLTSTLIRNETQTKKKNVK